MDDESKIRRYFETMTFPKSEPETLIELIKDVKAKSTDVQGLIRDYFDSLVDFFTRHRNASWFFVPSVDKSFSYEAGGVDGSFFPIESFAGNWYIPFSIAMIHCKSLVSPVSFDIVVKGGSEFLATAPRVTVGTSKTAGLIDKVPQEVAKKASELMFYGEVNAIKQVSKKMQENSYLFIDGPIIDPPTGGEPNYISQRCEAIKFALRRGISVIGVVKRIRDRYIGPAIFEKLFHNLQNPIINKLSKSGDQALLAPLLSIYRRDRREYQKTLASDWVPLETNEADKYKANEIKVIAGILQRELDTFPIRIEVAINAKDISFETKWKEAVGAVSAWTYPGQSIPFPVMLAHTKCAVTQDLATVLHNEFLTRIHSQDSEYQLLLRTIT
ncbi:MAG: DNA double-strand break repair nuclease NurA [Candidatus Odinarchaeota archaeon]